MPRNVTVQFSTETQQFPAGKTPGLYRYQIIDAAGAIVQSHDDAATTYTFPAVASGDYTALVEILDSTGAIVPEFPALTGVFSVPADIVTGAVPLAINVVVE